MDIDGRFQQFTTRLTNALPTEHLTELDDLCQSARCIRGPDAHEALLASLTADQQHLLEIHAHSLVSEHKHRNAAAAVNGLQKGPWSRHAHQLVGDFGIAAFKSERFMVAVRQLAQEWEREIAMPALRAQQEARRKERGTPSKSSRWKVADVTQAQLALKAQVGHRPSRASKRPRDAVRAASKMAVIAATGEDGPPAKRLRASSDAEAISPTEMPSTASSPAPNSPHRDSFMSPEIGRGEADAPTIHQPPYGLHSPSSELDLDFAYRDGDSTNIDVLIHEDSPSHSAGEDLNENENGDDDDDGFYVPADTLEHRGGAEVCRPPDHFQALPQTLAQLPSGSTQHHVRQERSRPPTTHVSPSQGSSVIDISIEQQHADQHPKQPRPESLRIGSATLAPGIAPAQPTASIAQSSSTPQPSTALQPTTSASAMTSAPATAFSQTTNPSKTTAAKAVRQLHGGEWLDDESMKLVLDVFVTCAPRWYVCDPCLVAVAQAGETQCAQGPLRLRGLTDEHTAMVVPIAYRQNHWLVAVVDRARRSVDLFDPLHSSEHINAAVKTVQGTFARVEHLAQSEWKYRRENCGLEQKDVINCGIYVLVYAIHKMLGMEVPDNIQPAFWRRIFSAASETKLAKTDQNYEHTVRTLTDDSLPVTFHQQEQQQVPPDLLNLGQLTDGCHAICRLRERLAAVEVCLREIHSIARLLRALPAAPPPPSSDDALRDLLQVCSTAGIEPSKEAGIDISAFQAYVRTASRARQQAADAIRAMRDRVDADEMTLRDLDAHMRPKLHSLIDAPLGLWRKASAAMKGNTDFFRLA